MATRPPGMTAPGPSGGQMLRGFATIRNNPLQFLHRTWLQFGDIAQFPIPNPPTYLVTDPRAANRVLQGNHRNYGKRTLQYQRLALLTGYGLLAADTDQWRGQRPIVQPAFGADLPDRVRAESEAAAKELATTWTAGEIVDVDQAMQELSLVIVGRVMFGTDLRGQAADLARATLEGLEVVVRRSRSPIAAPPNIPTKTNRQLARANAELDEAVDRMLQHPAPTGTLLAELQKADIPRQEVRDQIVTFLVAGHETVASALGWSLFLLAKHPTNAASADVFNEALRLFPPAWLITRQALGEDTLCDADIAPGSLIIISPYLVHRHRPTWPEPHAFRPGREYPRHAFIPFGAGPRMCIGRGMSLIEGEVVLDVLRERFRFEPTATPQLRPEVTLRPVGGLPLRLAAANPLS